MRPVGAGICWIDSGKPGRSVCVSFGVHGNERPPIVAGLDLVSRLEAGKLRLARGKLLLVHANPKATNEDRRWSDGGVDLNRCFHPDVLGREPSVYEELRAREIVAALEMADGGAPDVLVDFHCTVEPGRRFLMHHPPASDAKHQEVARLLAAETVLADPELRFGGVSLDEWMSTRGKVGICYETGWLGDPLLTGTAVLTEMLNVLAGLGLLEGARAHTYDGKERLELDGALLCEGPGFRWEDGVGENLQRLKRGSRLGAYAGTRAVTLPREAVLVFPKKKPELVQPGKPLVYLAKRA